MPKWDGESSYERNPRYLDLWICIYVRLSCWSHIQVSGAIKIPSSRRRHSSTDILSYHVSYLPRVIQSPSGNFEVFDDSSSTVNATVFSYFGGAIGARLPDKNAWMHAYEGDPITVALKALTSTPSLITKKNLEKVPFFYISPLRKGCIVIKDDFLVLKDTQSNHSYQITRILPKGLYNIVFIAFRASRSTIMNMFPPQPSPYSPWCALHIY